MATKTKQRILSRYSRLWGCPNCEYQEYVSYEFLALQGSPVCPHCDTDMEFEPCVTKHNTLTAKNDQGATA